MGCELRHSYIPQWVQSRRATGNAGREVVDISDIKSGSLASQPGGQASAFACLLMDLCLWVLVLGPALACMPNSSCAGLEGVEGEPFTATAINKGHISVPL